MYNKPGAKCLKTCLISALTKRKGISLKLQSKFVGMVIWVQFIHFMCRERIDAWIQDPNKTDDKDGVNIETRNAYQRRLIYQEVRKQWVATIKNDALSLIFSSGIRILLPKVVMVSFVWSNWPINSVKNVSRNKCSNSRYFISWMGVSYNDMLYLWAH